MATQRITITRTEPGVLGLGCQTPQDHYIDYGNVVIGATSDGRWFFASGEIADAIDDLADPPAEIEWDEAANCGESSLEFFQTRDEAYSEYAEAQSAALEI